MEDKHKIEISDVEYQRLILSEIKNELIKKLDGVDDIDIFKNILHNTVKEVERIPKEEVIPVKDIIFKEIKTFTMENEVLRKLNEYYVFRTGLLTIGGKTHSGKTSLLLNIILDILKKNPVKVCYIALDDSPTFIAKKIASMMLNKDMREIGIEDWNKVKENEVLDRFYITSRFDLNNKSEYEVIVLDYFQNIPIPSNVDTRNYFNKMLFDIKEFVKTNNILFILVSQVNRERKKEKSEFYYRETSELENLSDVCLDIENEYFDNDKTQYKGNRIVIKKNKEFPTYKEFEVHFRSGVLMEGFLEETYEDKKQKNKKQGVKIYRED